MTKTTIRQTTIDGVVYFAVIDLAWSLRDQKAGGLKSGVVPWLRKNLPDGSILKALFSPLGNRRGGNLICVAANHSKVVGIYAAHLARGGDFRARWCDLPDMPLFDDDAALEVAWRTMGSLSRRQIQQRSDADPRLLSKMSRLRWYYLSHFGRHPSGSWAETFAEYEEAMRVEDLKRDAEFQAAVRARDGVRS